MILILMSCLLCMLPWINRFLSFHIHFAVADFCSLLCSIHIALMLKNIDWMAPATFVAGTSLFFGRLQTQTVSIVLYFCMSPDAKQAVINGGAVQCLKSRLASHVKNQQKAKENRRKTRILAHQRINYHATALMNTVSARTSNSA